MYNYVILKDFKDRFMGVIAHDYKQGKIFYKVRNKFTDQLLQELFKATHYISSEDESMEILRELEKTDSDYLEHVISKFDQYKVDEVEEGKTDDYRNHVREEYAKLINEHSDKVRRK